METVLRPGLHHQAEFSIANPLQHEKKKKENK